MRVLALWRYPVKGMLGERLDAVAAGAGGVDGDRRWLVIDAASGRRIANKRGTDPRLRACRARIAGGELAVTLPDGDEVSGATAVAGALTDLLQRRVVLAEHDGRGDRYARTGGHHDFAPVHVVTTGELARLRRLAPEYDWDARRFRPNVLLDGDEDVLGAELESGTGVRLRVGLPCPRCVVPTRATEELPAAPSLLRALRRDNLWDLGPLGRGVCLGAYAEVLEPGTITEGEQLALAPGATSVRATVDRVAAELDAR
jgi:uncharacterized protein YcbX